MADVPNPDTELVSVLQTTEFGLIPMARAALEQAGVEYMIRDTSISNEIMGQRSVMSIGETDTPVHVLVRAEDEAKARAALGDFGAASAAAGARQPGDAGTRSPALASAGGGASASAGSRAVSHGDVEIVDEQTGASLGRITDADFRILQAQLEEESVADRNYFIDGRTLALLEDRGLTPALTARLRAALGSRDGFELRWSRA